MFQDSMHKPKRRDSRVQSYVDEVDDIKIMMMIMMMMTKDKRLVKHSCSHRFHRRIDLDG